MTDIEVFKNEIECVRRRATNLCNGGSDCSRCDLLMCDEDIISAYKRAIEHIEVINRQKEEIEFKRKRIFSDTERIASLENTVKILETKLNEVKSASIKGFAHKVYKFFCETSNWNRFKNEWLENGECYWLRQKIDSLVKEEESV